jgi:hypothetical protein
VGRQLVAALALLAVPDVQQHTQGQAQGPHRRPNYHPRNGSWFCNVPTAR